VHCELILTLVFGFCLLTSAQGQDDDTACAGDQNVVVPQSAPETGDSSILPKDRAAKPRTLSKRDSTLQNILQSIERDDQSPEGSSLAEVPQERPLSPAPKLMQRVQTLSGPVLSWAGRHPLYAVITICAIVLCMAFWIVYTHVRATKYEKRFMTTTRLSLMDGEVQRACLHIEKQFMDPAMTPASVCAAIVTGQPFLEAMFEKDLGMGIAEYIDQVRIHHARQIIKWNPAADSSFVAAHAGFTTASALENTFRQITGADLKSFRAEKQRSSKMPS
jgi:AraC-like DNA-binding protein